jgi:protein-tyrosine phosphatase
MISHPAAALIDLHSHVLAAVDDGASDLDEAVAALRGMRDAGVTCVVATPHVDGSLTLERRAIEARLGEIDAAWDALCRATAGHDGLPSLRRGVELKLDTPEPDVADGRLRMAGTDFVLVEFPYMAVPPRSAAAITALRASSRIPLIAHPERYHGIIRALHTIGEWRNAGAYLQVNAGSLLGRYGPDAQRVATALLERGWVDYLASDHHARGRFPHTPCIEFLEANGGTEQAQLLFSRNPERLLQNAAPLPVPPLQSRAGLWDRIARVFR